MHALYNIIILDIYIYVGLVTLRSILSFFSGGEEVPPIGFDYTPELNFNSENIFLTASFS